MQLAPFFDPVPRLRVRDPRAGLPGCREDGVIAYGDAHAMPGGSRVDTRERARHGDTGLTAAAAQMLTGAAHGTALAAPVRLRQERGVTRLLDRADDPAVFVLRHVDRRRDDPDVHAVLHVLRGVDRRQHAHPGRR